MPRTLNEIVAHELPLLRDSEAKAEHLAAAIESGNVPEKEIPEARKVLAFRYESLRLFGQAADQHEKIGDTERTRVCYLLEADELVLKYKLEEAAEIYVRFGETQQAIKAMCSTKDARLNNILSVLPGDRTENIRTIRDTLDPCVANYGVLAECNAELGNHKTAAEFALQLEHPNYTWAIRELELAEEYVAAAEACLRARADDFGSLFRKTEYGFPAFDFFLKAKQFDRAIAVCCDQLSGFTGGADRIHSVYVAQGVAEKEAWKLAAQTITQRAEPSSALYDSVSHAYEQAGMLVKTGDALMQSRPSEHYSGAYGYFVASGMTAAAAAQRVLESREQLHHWQVGDLCKKAGMWEEAITAFETQKRNWGHLGDKHRWDAELAPLYETVGRWDAAANSYEKIRNTHKAIECRIKGRELATISC